MDGGRDREIEGGVVILGAWWLMAVLRFVRHWRWLEEEIVERSTHLITAFQFRHTVHTRTYTHTLAQNNITNNSLTSTLICNTHAHKYVDTRFEHSKMFSASSAYLQTECKYFFPFFFFSCSFFFTGIELKRLWSRACWACTFSVCSHPIPDRPWGTKLIKPQKISKIPTRTLWAVAPHGLWLEYEIETQTYGGTCRTRFDDAVEQTLLSDNTTRLIVFTIHLRCVMLASSCWLKVVLVRAGFLHHLSCILLIIYALVVLKKTCKASEFKKYHIWVILVG